MTAGLGLAAVAAGAAGIAYATGPNEAQGPPGPTIFRAAKGTPNEVQITAVGTGPIGFPAEGSPPTDVLTLDLPPGLFAINTNLGVRKDSGNGDFLCWTLAENTIGFLRASLGSDAGHVRRTTLTSTFVVNVPSGGEATLSCWQATNGNVPGSPSGENPTVFFANITATKLWRATITRQPSGEVVNLP